MPVSFLFSAGIPPPTALAAPVLEGMMFSRMPRPPRQSLFEGPSTVFCVAVAACTVVIRPRLMPHLSFSTLATGARQFVVHDEHEHGGVVLGGGRQDDLLGTSVQVLLRGDLVQEQAGGFDHHVGADFVPLQVGGVALLREADLLAVDDQGVALDRDFALEAAM